MNDLHPRNVNAWVLREAARFWEPRRFYYNPILAAVVLLWVILTWPHFRPALTLGSLEAFIVLALLALLANLCYCAAYLADIFTQFMSSASRRRFRWALFILGTLFALVLENYWIADEIYPYASQPPTNIFAGTSTMPTAAPM